MQWCSSVMKQWLKNKNTSERDYNTTKAAIWKCGEVQAAKHCGIANNNHKLDQMKVIIISKMQKRKRKTMPAVTMLRF